MVVNTRSNSRRVTRSSTRHKPPSNIVPAVGSTAKRTKQLAVTIKQKKTLKQSTDEERMIASPEEAIQVPPAAQVVVDQGLKESVAAKPDDRNEAGAATGQIRLPYFFSDIPFHSLIALQRPYSELRRGTRK
ncbi:hypothetical protein PQX77_020531 [Marasmius sp. AFHP31]|nr:hypothetical protein PQX77_020531 [Marasmius sp. AFHP31]